MKSLSDHILGFSPFRVSKAKTPFQVDLRKKRTISFLFDQSEKSINKHKRAKEGLCNYEMFCLSERWPTPSVKQQIWLSTSGGKDYQKCQFREHTES